MMKLSFVENWAGVRAKRKFNLYFTKLSWKVLRVETPIPVSFDTIQSENKCSVLF